MSLLDELRDLLSPDPEGIVPVPILVKGEMRRPPSLSLGTLQDAARDAPAGPGGDRRFRCAGAQVLQLAPKQDSGPFLLLPDFDPRDLLEEDAGALSRGLYALPFREVMAYVGALREVLRSAAEAARRATAFTQATSAQHGGEIRLLFEILPELFDPEALAEAVDRELGDGDASGRQYLDGWVAVTAPGTRGVTARQADALLGAPPSPPPPLRVRAVPTRQLHVTAGNSPLLPLLSLLRAFATKGAAVVKSPAASTAPAALLALAMRAVDAAHPITRHTSLVYWPGGDRRFEDVLFAPGAFDRLVVWGSPETVRSVTARAPFIKTILLNPRYGLSFIGREPVSDAFAAAASRAAVDTLIADQKACTSSLVHFVEGTEDDALRYCRALQEALALWDRAFPRTLPERMVGLLRRLRRQELARAVWFENGPRGAPSSAVVLSPLPFDLSLHPLSRFVVVRRVDDLRDALPALHSGVSALGVYPEERRRDLLDEIAGRGVDKVFPLGEGERAYAGMPHDGMRIASELVRWCSG